MLIKNLKANYTALFLSGSISVITSLIIISFTGCSTLPTSEETEFADIHLHYNYTHEEVIDVTEIIKKLKKNNISLAVVSSEPTDLALDLSNQAPNWIIPFATPYYKAGNRLNWYFDKTLLNELRRRLETGQFAGIGEVHITAGIGPRRDNPVFTGLLELAQEFNLPFLLHTDANDYRYFLPVCTKYDQVRFLWAHAGGILQPEQLKPLLEQCPNVWLDLAARDPDHYGALTDQSGKLLNGWYELLIQYQDRIMTGSDPVWNAQQIYRWYEADEGWDHYDTFVQFHRKWLKQLPADVEKKIRLENAKLLFSDYLKSKK